MSTTIEYTYYIPDKTTKIIELPEIIRDLTRYNITNKIAYLTKIVSYAKDAIDFNILSEKDIIVKITYTDTYKKTYSYSYKISVAPDILFLENLPESSYYTLMQCIFNKDGQLNSDTTPAITEYIIQAYNNKIQNKYKDNEIWCRNGVIHRDNGPAYIDYLKSGDIIETIWYKNGNIHRENEPAVIKYRSYDHTILEKKIWYFNGNIHREDAPAYITYFDSGKIAIEKWYKHGQLHRENDPAIVEYFSNKNIKFKEYYINGYLYNNGDFTSFKYDSKGRCTNKANKIDIPSNNTRKNVIVFDNNNVYQETLICENYYHYKEYYRIGSLKMEYFASLENENIFYIREDDKPNLIYYYEDGTISEIKYCINTIRITEPQYLTLHRLTGPAHISYNVVNRSNTTELFYINGERKKLTSFVNERDTKYKEEYIVALKKSVQNIF